MSQQVGVFDSNGRFQVITIESGTADLPAGYYNSPGEAAAVRGGNSPAPPVAVSPLASQPPAKPASIPSPAFDINGELVTIDLPGGDYANLPAGYYETPGQATVARHDHTQSGADTPMTAQQVGALYSDPTPATQAALQTIFSAPPPPPSTYVAPTAPIATGWVEPVVTPPPTPADIISQSYIANGYTPPPDHVIQQIISGAIVAPITTPLPAAAVPPPAAPATAATVPVDISAPTSQTANHSVAVMTAVQYAAQRPDLLVNWARAKNPAWVIAHPDSFGVIQFIQKFPTLSAFLANDYGQAFAAGADPVVSAEINAEVASEVPANTEPAATTNKNVAPTAAQYAVSRPDLLVNWQRAFDPANANDSTAKWIRSFGTVEAYLANDYGAAFSPGPAVVVQVATVTTPASTTGGTGAVTVAASGGVTTAHRAADSVHHLVGSDKFGSPVYQLIDADGHLIQWTEFHGKMVDTANLLNAPLGVYVPQAQTYTTAAASAGAVSVTTHRAADATHHYVANDKWGNPVYQLIDTEGNLIQWTEYQNQMFDTTNLLGSPLGVYVPQAQTYMTAPPATTQPAPGPGGTVTVTTAVAPKSNALLIAGVAALAIFALTR